MSEERLLTFAEAVAAYEAGKEVQWRMQNSKSRWSETIRGQGWYPHREEYRLKPEPERPIFIWVNRYRNSTTLFGHDTEEAALKGPR